MIILDTNIVSEVMRPAPNESVMTWLDLQNIDDLYLTSISLAEIYYGLYRMPDGKRKQGLLTQLQHILDNLFHDKQLDFTHQHATVYGDICAHSEKIGHPIAMADAQIASIAKHYQVSLVTRNTKDFIHCGIDVINPF